ncbi:hypothetical protein CO174_04230 [Candidatus Uhrbacteria bacterium CG_4_9_14_3_um_filter_50_9]|uniref:HemN C-terminal domain-containing protein n=1 Tax=Candidatus Uhrbacteria bacterium CG_4_9_14_3_um_filter_50_9 TaxID=1975035 RepID=A0A2M7XBD8_9BACT|nr:MAG: hypothetical protein CO174_04230 [Candidatus Uhrbacteria bacterium CG_4_9_14_3_um_filter_50_9]
MSSIALDDVSPWSFKIPSYGIGSTDWSCFKMETVAHSIIRICQRAGNWISFTWQDYCQLCLYEPDEIEHRVLDWLVADGALRMQGNTYTPTNRFVQVLRDFITRA